MHAEHHACRRVSASCTPPSRRRPPAAGDIQVHHEQGLVSVDGWARFKAPARIAVLVRELRAEVSRLLAHKVQQPTLDVASSRGVEAMHHLLASDGF